ncbi:MAG: hypothetical protein Q8T09_18715 [Candidatus Melainabacteria bacterium]|nr:hypothetical protein [Candidatus Melainabacteria bacterium]
MLPKQITVSLLALFLLTALPALALEPSASKPAKTSSTASKPVAKSAANPGPKSVDKGSATLAEKTKTKATAAASSPAAKSSAAVAPSSQSWTGYLVDRSCAAAIKGDNKDAIKSVKEHTKACSLEPSCCEAGFSIYSQGQWLDLDNGSSAIAKKVMQATTRDKAHVVKVVGIIKRGEVRATSIVEVN